MLLGHRVCPSSPLPFLLRHPKPKKILRYFETTFATVSGEDHLLQLDEFQEALRKNLVGSSHCEKT